MNLLIDIGNTRIKYVFDVENKLSYIKYCAFDSFDKVLDDLTSIQQILLVSVSNQDVANNINEWANNNHVLFKQIETQAEHDGIVNGYTNHRQMGADRWLAIVGAQFLYPNENILIVDSGTATTFDVLCNNKQHVGGWIIPGVDMMMESLFANTDKVVGEIGKVDQIRLAQNTNDNVNYGCWAATLGAIESAKISALNKGAALDRVLFTGGNGSRLHKLYSEQKYLKQNPQFSVYHQALIFVGLSKYL